VESPAGEAQGGLPGGWVGLGHRDDLLADPVSWEWCGYWQRAKAA